VLETAENFCNLVSKDRFPKLKDFAPNMHSMEINTCVRVYFLTMKQVKSKNINPMADETLDVSFRFVQLTLDLTKER